MSWVAWLTLGGIALYTIHLLWDLGHAVLRGDIDGADIEHAMRSAVDSDTYDGSYGTRDGQVWCELCHRYHPA